MHWKSFAPALVLGALLSWTLAGCGGSSEQQTAPDTGVAQQPKPAVGGEATHEHEEAGHQHEHGNHADEHGEEADEVPKLSDADRALADSQQVCPVSGEELTSMGTPVKVTVKGKTFFLCCKSCKKKLDADPDQYLAKLAKIRAGEEAAPVQN